MDDGKPHESGTYGASRAVKEIATLHDAVRAVLVAGRGDLRPLAAECERLAVLLVQGYNHLLSMAVAADDRHGSRLRFDAVAAIEPYDTELADVGVRRGGDGGLSLHVGQLAQAMRDRPAGSARALREAAGACASLAGWLSRALTGLAESTHGPGFTLTAPGASVIDEINVAMADHARPGPTGAIPDGARPGQSVRALDFGPPSGPMSGTRPTFYA
ncbi:MAG: hypothetical protein FJZ01_13945 [Candidatus Sericytochromatia bacterium]|nr:hypothetical protein [Candidatus Tanganyikabacteria bacterium]